MVSSAAVQQENLTFPTQRRVFTVFSSFPSQPCALKTPNAVKIHLAVGHKTFFFFASVH